MSNASALKSGLTEQARALGFAGLAVASADPLAESRRIFVERVRDGLFEGMPWITEERAERATDPARSVAGARSVVTLAAPYHHRLSVTADDVGNGPRGRVARYAWGRDYHRVLEKKLKRLCAWLAEAVPGSSSRPLVDYGPLAERAYAARAGLGWIGKSTNLLMPAAGSWVLLAEIVTSIALEPDAPLRKSCGGCHRCMDGCPTAAITEPWVLDSRRCISFHTIEQRGPIPRAFRPAIGDWLFGCDDCQDVCPVPGRPPPMPELGVPDLDDAAPPLIPLLALDHDAFVRRFAGRPLMRAKRDGLLRNACVVLGNLGDDAAVPALATALLDSAALVRGHAAWALGRIGTAVGRQALTRALLREPDVWVQQEIQVALEEDWAPPPAADLVSWLAGGRRPAGEAAPLPLVG